MSNKVELLPRDFYYKDDLYQLNLWITGFGRICIGYRNSLDVKHTSLVSVCVEPENEPHNITDPNSGWLNAGIGNTRNLDDACDMLKKYLIDNNYINEEYYLNYGNC